jgi:hypothetical protein
MTPGAPGTLLRDLTSFVLRAGMILAIVATPSRAIAQRRGPPTHIATGRAAAAQSDWTKALSEFREAEAEADSVDALEGIADAEYELGKDDEAYEAYLVLSRGIERFKLDAKQRRKVEAIVSRRLSELAGRTGRVAVAVEGTGGKVFLDERELGPAPLSAIVRVAAGTHRLHVEMVKGDKQERTVTVAAGADVVVELRLAPPVPTPPAPHPEAGAAGGPPKAPEARKGDEAEGHPKAPPPQYVPVRAAKPPKIDGVLTDDIWKLAPGDSHFSSSKSKPYGQPSNEPTTVQVAYDDEYLYVAFRCLYSGPRHRDDSFPTDDTTTTVSAESVAVAIDPLQDSANALVLYVSRSGARADNEVTASGEQTNADWKGLWDVATTHTPDAWYAEFRIPWGSLRLPRHEDKFSVGINFARREPSVGELSFWSLPPSASGFSYDPTYFGTLAGLDKAHPGLRLYLQPYVAVAVDQQAGTLRSRLDDFAGTQSNFRAFAGAYARFFPPGPVRIEATFNPDFSAVPPDAAVANFSRFELSYPEVRPFFTEDNPRFFFGDDDFPNNPIDPTAQLFYSRRIGLITTNKQTGATTSVPILYGAKAIVREGSTEVAAMNVGLSSPNPALTLNDNISVVRFNQNFGEGRRVGAIFLGRTGDVSNYAAEGVDGSFSLFDRRFIIDGFLARTETQGAPSSGMGEIRTSFATENFNLSASYLDVGTAFDAQLGLVPVTGSRSTWITVGYKELLGSDLQKKITLYAGLNDTKDRGDVLIYDNAFAQALLTLNNGAQILARFTPSIQNITTPLPLNAGRLTITDGRYAQMDYELYYRSAARLPVVVTLDYQGGDLYAGQVQSPAVTLELNLGRFSTSSQYQFYDIRYNGQELSGHQVSSVTSFSYSSLAKTTLVVQANTLINRAVAQLVNSYWFGLLSRVSLVVSKSTGGNTVGPDLWLGSGAPFSAELSFSYGLSPF